MRHLAGKGNRLVLCQGGDFLPAARRVAPDYPQTAFVVIDAPSQGGTRGEAPNVTTAFFACEEGAFLAGLFAAKMAASKGGAKIGFVGGADSPALRACLASYRAGAAQAGPVFRGAAAILGRFCGRGESGFTDPAAAKSIAAAMFASGASVVYHMAGESGRGVFEAAIDAGSLAVGSDYDQESWYRSSGSAAERRFASVIAGSMVKRGDLAARLFVREFLASGHFPGGDRKLGVAQGCIDIATGAAVSKDLAEELAAIRADLASGKILLPSGDALVPESVRPKK